MVDTRSLLYRGCGGGNGSSSSRRCTRWTYMGGGGSAQTRHFVPFGGTGNGCGTVLFFFCFVIVVLAKDNRQELHSCLRGGLLLLLLFLLRLFLLLFGTMTTLSRPCRRRFGRGTTPTPTRGLGIPHHEGIHRSTTTGDRIEGHRRLVTASTAMTTRRGPGLLGHEGWNGKRRKRAWSPLVLLLLLGLRGNLDWIDENHTAGRRSDGTRTTGKGSRGYGSTTTSRCHRRRTTTSCHSGCQIGTQGNGRGGGIKQCVILEIGWGRRRRRMIVIIVIALWRRRRRRQRHAGCCSTDWCWWWPRKVQGTKVSRVHVSANSQRCWCFGTVLPFGRVRIRRVFFLPPHPQHKRKEGSDASIHPVAMMVVQVRS